MDISQESVQEFVVGHGGADAVSKSIVASGHARKAYKSVRVRAATANTITLYVGPAGVTVESGYPLPAGEELEVKIENPSRIHVVAEPAGNSQQIVTLTVEVAGDTFTLALDGEATDPIAVAADAATVQTALEAVVGAGNCTVAGNAGGPYTVEFVGDLAKSDVHFLVGTGNGVNETQNVTITDALAGDKLVLTFDGDTAAELAHDATSAQVQAALEALSSVGPGNVSVTDGATGWDVEFTGDLGKSDVDAITGACGKNEKQTISLPDTVDVGTFTLTLSGETTAPIAYGADAATVQTALEGLPSVGAGQVVVTGGAGPADDWVAEFTGTLAKTDVALITATSSCGNNEKQTISIDDATTDGTFTLTLDSQTTDPIAYNADAAAVQAALEGMANVGVGQVSVTGGPGPGTDWVAEFTGTLALTDILLMVGDGALLVGGSTVVIVEETVKGNTAAVTVEETVKGNQATVTVTEAQPGGAPCTVAVTKTDASAGSQYSWIAV